MHQNILCMCVNHYDCPTDNCNSMTRGLRLDLRVNHHLSPVKSVNELES